MSSALIVVLVLVGLVVLVLMYGVGVFNRLVALKNRYENGFAQIEVQLKRRHDLIPGLVETVKGYMAHEKETLEAVIQARNQAVGGLAEASGNPGDPSAMKNLGGAEGALAGAHGSNGANQLAPRARALGTTTTLRIRADDRWAAHTW